MNNKKVTIMVVLLLLILAVVVFAVMSQKNNGLTASKNPKATNVVNEKTNSSQSLSTEKEEALPEGVDADTVAPSAPAQLSVMPGSPEAPKQAVIKAEEVPAAAIKLTVSDSGFSPKEFTVQAGQKASLAVTASGDNTHVFIFPNASLMALTMMVSGGETKVMEFTAPAAGTYTFRDDIPTFRNNTGTMIVK